MDQWHLLLTSDPVERTALSSWRTVGSQLAGLVINVVGPIILFVDNKAVPSRFFMAALIFGLLAIACYIACYRLTTERIVVDETEKPKPQKGATIKGLVKNKPLIWIPCWFVNFYGKPYADWCSKRLLV